MNQIGLFSVGAGADHGGDGVDRSRPLFKEILAERQHQVGPSKIESGSLIQPLSQSIGECGRIHGPRVVGGTEGAHEMSEKVVQDLPRLGIQESDPRTPTGRPERRDPIGNGGKRFIPGGGDVASIVDSLERPRDSVRGIEHIQTRLAYRAESSTVQRMLGIPFQSYGKSVDQPDR